MSGDAGTEPARVASSGWNPDDISINAGGGGPPFGGAGRGRAASRTSYDAKRHGRVVAEVEGGVKYFQLRTPDSLTLPSPVFA